MPFNFRGPNRCITWWWRDPPFLSLKHAGALIGGTIFAMAVYMPIRFQQEETRKEASDEQSDEQMQNR